MDHDFEIGEFVEVDENSVVGYCVGGMVQNINWAAQTAEVLCVVGNHSFQVQLLFRYLSRITDPGKKGELASSLAELNSLLEA